MLSRLPWTQAFFHPVTFALLVALVVSSVFFVLFPQVDLWMAAHFFIADREFIMTNHPVGTFFDRDLHNGIEIGLILFILVWLAGEVRRKPLFGITRKRFLYVLLAMGLSAGVLCNMVFKAHWGRARPHQIEQFGGDKTFSPAWIITDQCENNCSFFSGDASLGAGLLAFAFLATKFQPYWLLGTGVLGLTMGVMRMLRGAHFLSDVVVAILLTTWFVLFFRTLILQPSHSHEHP